MSGLIEVNADGSAKAAFGKTPAWHGLGTVFDDDMTPDQALVAASLNGWNVRLARTIVIEEYTVNEAEVALLAADPITATRFVPSKKYSTIRTNPSTGEIEELGAGRGEGFTVVQNEELVAFLDALVDGGAKISAAGSLRNGTQVFFCLKLPSDIYVGGFDKVETYLTVMNGHDGSLAVKAVAAPVRVVCANTQEAALQSAQSSWTHRHTKGATQAVANARHDLDLTFAYAAEFEAEVNRMIETPFSLGEFDKLTVELFKDPGEEGLGKRGVSIRKNKIDAARAIWLNGGPTMAGIENTRYGAYQAVTEFIDHGWGKDQLIRAERSVDGEGQKIRHQAFGLLSVPA
jgi:phage/plasmid-like protein (TIGR03299 family)